MSNRTKAGWAVLAIVAVGLAGLIGYIAGANTSVAVHCKAGRVVAVNVSGADGRGNGTRTVEIGDCARLSDHAFVEVVDALVGATPTSTTTSTTSPGPATTTSAKP